ncbi:Short-chain dehydrogenase reductase SDR, partial [Nowakowskiella sp. JEL0078]
MEGFVAKLLKYHYVVQAPFMKIHGNVFIVTGGVGGLGEAVVRHLIARGALISIFDLNEEGATKLVSELNSSFEASSPDSVFLTNNPKIQSRNTQLFYPGLTDITNEQQVIKSVDETLKFFSTGSGKKVQLSGVVNCGGISVAMTVLDRIGLPQLSSDVFERVLKINVIGTFNLCKVAAGKMSKNTVNNQGERGVIINISSVAFQDGQTGQVAYSASKGAVASMTLPLARDLA